MERLPGTTLTVETLSPQEAARSLNNLFAGGGLVLSQVTALIGIEPHAVQNWVKRGFVSSPVAKKYSRRQFCRLTLIRLLKDCMPIGDITVLLSYINGDLADESDDLVDDDDLYLYLVALICHVRTTEEGAVARAAAEVTADYRERAPGARERLSNTLQIMYFTYRAARLRQKAAALSEACLTPT